MDHTWNKEGANHFKNRNYEDAYSCFSNALRADPFNSVYLINRSAALAALDRPSEAMLDADNALRLSPHNARAFLRKGNALIMLQRYDEAWSALEAGLQLLPGDMELQTALARAKTHLMVSAPQPDHPIPNLIHNQSLLGHVNHPQSPVVASGSPGKIVVEQKEGAVEMGKGFMSSWFGGLSGGVSANKRGVEFLQQGKPEEALKELTAAVDASANNYQFLCNRASAYLELERYDDAMKDIDRALQLAPTFIVAHLRKAKISSACNQLNVARGILNHASKVATSNKDKELVENAFQELQRREMYLSFVQPDTMPDDEEPPPYPGMYIESMN